MALWLNANGFSGGVAIGRVLKSGQVVPDQDRQLECAASVPDNPRDDLGSPKILVCGKIEPACRSDQGGHKIAAIVAECNEGPSPDAIENLRGNIPVVTGSNNALGILNEGEWLIVDGQTGDLIASPDAFALTYYRNKQEKSDRASAP